MRPTASLLLLTLLAGCGPWSWDFQSTPTITTWTPTPDRPIAPLPPTKDMRVWIGVPPAVPLTTAKLTDFWPEYEPLSAPSNTAIWVSEHWDWDWDGVDGWVWLRGRWIEPPGRGFEWNAPTWVQDEQGTYFVAGFFCAPPEAVTCRACGRRPELRRSHIACRPGLDAATKRALARRSMPSGTAVAQQ
jgi:hypothetical protein